jgi:hypothetical protein
MLEVRSIDKKFDWNTHRLVIQVGLSDGRTVGIAFPMGHMHIALDESLGELGYYEPCEMGDDFETIGSLWSRVKRLTKKVGRAVSRSAVGKMYTKTIGKATHIALQAGRGLVRNKAFGALVGAAAVAFPAVGGPALAALAVAKRAQAIQAQANRARALIARGARHPALLAKVTQGQRVAQTMAQTAAGNSPFGQMVVSSLKSMAA